MTKRAIIGLVIVAAIVASYLLVKYTHPVVVYLVLASSLGWALGRVCRDILDEREWRRDREHALYTPIYTDALNRRDVQ